MFPILIRLGPFTLRTYGLLLALGFGAGIWLARRRARDRGLDPETVTDLCFYPIVGGILGARLFYVLTYPSHYLAHPLEILKIWEGGLVYYGGFIGALALGAWHMRRHRLDFAGTADLTAPPLALGQAIGRLGCFSAGCCWGRPTGLPWAVIFYDPHSLAPRGIPLHPSQLYMAGADLFLFLALLAIDRRRRFRGETFLSYLILYALLRSTLEFTRGDDRGSLLGLPLSPAQVIGVILLVVGGALWIRMSSKTAPPGGTSGEA